MPSGGERQAGVRSQMACLPREGVCTDPKGNGVRQKVSSKGMPSDACCLPSEFMVFIGVSKISHRASSAPPLLLPPGVWGRAEAPPRASGGSQFNLSPTVH